jgi:anti-sigma factor (TIGR02949 family)
LNCQEVRELLSPYLDRELTSEEMTDIAMHLESCKACMEQSTVFGQLSRVIKHWEGIQATEEVKRRLMEQVRGAEEKRRDGRRTLPLALLALLAGALLVGGAGALLVYFMERAPAGDPGDRRAEVAECVRTAGRAELVDGGVPVRLEAPRKLRAGQELSCTMGAAAQIEGRADAAGRRWRAVLHGPGRLQVAEGLPELLEGRLALHPAAAGGGEGVLKVGRWAVVLPAGEAAPAVLAELLADGGLRVAVLRGSARIGAGGPLVAAGTEVTMDAGGVLSAPKPVADPAAFALLTGGTEGR